jgi:hypothetical protein
MRLDWWRYVYPDQNRANPILLENLDDNNWLNVCRRIHSDERRWMWWCSFKNKWSYIVDKHIRPTVAWWMLFFEVFLFYSNWLLPWRVICSLRISAVDLWVGWKRVVTTCSLSTDIIILNNHSMHTFVHLWIMALLMFHVGVSVWKSGSRYVRERDQTFPSAGSCENCGTQILRIFCF